MVRIEVPDAHDRGVVVLAGTPPNANETRLGAPREEDVRVAERYPRDVQVRRDDDGTRYVGIKADHADAVLEFFADTYGVTYNGDGEIASTETTTDTDSTESPDRPAPPGETQDAHWNAVVAAIQSGAYDGHLDTVADTDDRQSVQDAIDERRS